MSTTASASTVARAGRDPIPAHADFVFAIDVLHHVDDPAASSAP